MKNIDYTKLFYGSLRFKFSSMGSDIIKSNNQYFFDSWDYISGNDTISIDGSNSFTKKVYKKKRLFYRSCVRDILKNTVQVSMGNLFHYYIKTKDYIYEFRKGCLLRHLYWGFADTDVDFKKRFNIDYCKISYESATKFISRLIQKYESKLVNLFKDITKTDYDQRLYFQLGFGDLNRVMFLCEDSMTKTLSEIEDEEGVITGFSDTVGNELKVSGQGVVETAIN